MPYSPAQNARDGDTFRAREQPVRVALGVATLTFALIHFVPGDPVIAMLGDTAGPADIAGLRQDSTSLAGEHAFQSSHQCSGTLRGHAASVRPVQQQPYNCCVLGLGKFFGHLFEPARRGAAHRQRECAFG